MSDFKSFNLPAFILEALERMEFTTPTPIQKDTIPPALEGKDILGSAPTGTGKTGAFTIPMIDWLMKNKHGTALIMTPTRELATQVLNFINLLIRNNRDLRTALLIGGDPIYRQKQQLQRCPRILVGTPGRINDHLNQGTVNLSKVGYLVLDETDRMLDMGFREQLQTILERMPEKRQTLLFSATLPRYILELSKQYLNDAIRVSIGACHVPVEKIKQETIHISEDKKYDALISQLNNYQGSIIIFSKTKFGCERLSIRLRQDKHSADAIHGDLNQRRRERVIGSFRDKKFRILVATDVAARGLDIKHLECVINFDMPQCPEDYIHRIGRTARAGAEGSAVNFVTSQDSSKWRAICRLINPKEKHEQHRPNSDRPRRRSYAEDNGSTLSLKRPFGAQKSYGQGPKRNAKGGSYQENSYSKKPGQWRPQKRSFARAERAEV